MRTPEKKTARSAATILVTIELQPNAKQVDFNSKEIRDELEKVKERIQLVLNNAMVDSRKLSNHFTV